MNSKTCIRCNRQLKNPEAIKRGMGNICWQKMQMQKKDEQNDEVHIPFNGDIVCRLQGDKRVFNITQELVQHSPTGMNWGYAGSGPADFALNILYKFSGSKWFSERLHQQFKNEFIACMPKEGGTIAGSKIKEWINVKSLEAANDVVNDINNFREQYNK